MCARYRCPSIMLFAKESKLRLILARRWRTNRRCCLSRGTLCASFFLSACQLPRYAPMLRILPWSKSDCRWPFVSVSMNSTNSMSRLMKLQERLLLSCILLYCFRTWICSPTIAEAQPELNEATVVPGRTIPGPSPV